MGNRDTRFPIPKNELFYWDEVEGVLKPLIGTDGVVKVAISGLEGATGEMPVKISSSDIMQGVDIQNKYSQTTQTNSATVIAPNGTATSAWVNINGFTALGITMSNDAETESELVVQWSNDGTNLHGEEILVVGTSRYKPTYVRKSADYVRIKINNKDTATAHTFNSWINAQV